MTVYTLHLVRFLAVHMPKPANEAVQASAEEQKSHRRLLVRASKVPTAWDKDELTHSSLPNKETKTLVRPAWCES